MAFTQIGSGLVPVQGGGTGAGSLTVAIRSDNSEPAVFATFAALEAYTATTEGTADAARINVPNANLAQEAFVVGTLTNNAFVGDSTPYIRVNGAWVLSIASLRGLPGADGNAATVANLTDNTIPIKDPNNDQLIDGPLSVDPNTNRIKAAMSLEVPPGTIYIGANTALSAAIRALNVRSDITDNTGLVLAQLYDDTNGFSRPFAYSGDTVDTVQINDPTGSDISDNARFQITTTADELLFRIVFETENANFTGPFTLTVRTTSHTGPVAVEHTQTITTDGSGMATLDFREEFNPILVDNGTTLFVTATCDGFRGTQSGADFTPNATAHRIVIDRKNLAFTDDIPAPISPRTDDDIFDVFSASLVEGPNITISVDNVNNQVTISSTGSGGGTPPQAQHTNYIDVTQTNQANAVVLANAVTSDDLNPVVTLPTFTSSSYIQILQSQAHTQFTSLVISGINQLGGFTINENARTINGQAYRQYVSSNMVTNALSGQQITAGGAT